MPQSQSNNGPDVVLNLSHEQATFMLENCDANIRLALAMVMGIADDKIAIELKQAKAQKFINLSDKFRDIKRLLQEAGAKENDDD